MCLNNRFLESIKVEKRQPLLLGLHQKRVEKTFAEFGQPNNALDLQEILRKLTFPTDEIYKLRILYDMQGNFSTEFSPYWVTKIANFALVEAKDLDYAFKYENREIFSTLKEQSTTEEIIITQNGQITDTSFSNLAFLQGGKWFTPKTFLLNGVQRQFLLAQNLIKEADISLRNIGDFSHFCLLNAMRTLGDSDIYPLEAIQNLP